jgi:hypothetical protein
LEKPVTPEHLRAGAIILALSSVALFAVAAREWSARRSETDAMDTGRDSWRGHVLLFLVSIASVAGVLAVAGIAGWNRDRAMWVGVGGFLGLLTMVRPWWFWENYKARWLRKLIGDGATAVVYLAIAAIMVWIGLNTDWGFGRR